VLEVSVVLRIVSGDVEGDGVVGVNRGQGRRAPDAVVVVVFDVHVARPASRCAMSRATGLGGGVEWSQGLLRRRAHSPRPHWLSRPSGTQKTIYSLFCQRINRKTRVVHWRRFRANPI